MEYDEAKRIRSKDYSLSKLITSNIRQGGGVGASIKDALKEKFDVGTRTKAKITGIKEKFDPLNVAKFLTFGSNFAPALLGRMTGRSQKDINHFSGGARAKPYESATKLGKLDGDDSGLNDILNKIYTFMKSNQEDDIKQKELQNNHREEELIESHKKHKELLDALAKLTGNKVEAKDTATKASSTPSGPSFMDYISEAFGLGKDIFSILRTVGPLLANPLVLGLLGAIVIGGALAYLLANDKNSEETSKGIINAGAADGGLAETIMNANEDVVASRKNQLLAGRTGDEWSVFGDDEKQKTFLQKIGWDEKSATTKADRDAGIIGYDSEGEAIFKKKEGATATPVSPQSSSSTTTEESSPVTASESSPVSAVPEESSNAGQQMVNATNENNDAKLADLTSSPATNTVNSSQTNVTGKSSSSTQPLPPVRNLEDTFQRMIMNSTKVV